MDWPFLDPDFCREQSRARQGRERRYKECNTVYMRVCVILGLPLLPLQIVAF